MPTIPDLSVPRPPNTAGATLAESEAINEPIGADRWKLVGTDPRRHSAQFMERREILLDEKAHRRVSNGRVASAKYAHTHTP